MTRPRTRNAFAATLAAVFSIAPLCVGAPSENEPVAPGAEQVVDFFEAVDAGQADAKFIAKSDREARLIITNKTNQPLNLDLPDAFAGVPVAAQFGGGGIGGGGRGGGGFGGGGGGQQSVGGGLGGGGLGGGGLGGGGGGFFSIPPEQTAKIDMPVVCLDHGLRNPSSSKPYKIVPASAHLDRPAVVELLQAFGRGELDHGAVQAAAWHLNNDLSWQELAAKRTGTRRTPAAGRKPYFSRAQIQAAMSYATAAERLAYENRELHEENRRAIEERSREKQIESSEALSTSDDAVEPETTSDEQAEAPANSDTEAASAPDTSLETQTDE